MAKFGTGGGGWDTVDLATYPALTEHTTIRGGGDGAALPDFTPRVRVGMDVLDEVAAGWHRHVDLTALDLENTNSCVLGQTWPHYRRLIGASPLSEAFLFNAYTVYDHRTDIFEEVSNFKQMATHLATDAQADSHIRYAATIGCALGEEDCNLLNVRAKYLIHQRMGAAQAETAEGFVATTALVRKLSDEMFHELTCTWIREIKAARANRRWVEDQYLILPDHFEQPLVSSEASARIDLVTV